MNTLSFGNPGASSLAGARWLLVVSAWLVMQCSAEQEQELATVAAGHGPKEDLAKGPALPGSLRAAVQRALGGSAEPGNGFERVAGTSGFAANNQRAGVSARWTAKGLSLGAYPRGESVPFQNQAPAAWHSDLRSFANRTPVV